jgi:hypothetical protein
MKAMISVALLMASFSILAAPVDALLGVYKAKDRDGTAVVTKTLVSERTLFEPDVYAYQVEIRRKKDDIYRTVDLDISADGKSLSGSGSDDCDNNDCHAFNYLDVEVKKVGAEARLTLDYEGYKTTDGDDIDEPEEFSGSALFIKK